MFSHIISMLIGYGIGQLDARTQFTQKIYEATCKKLETAKNEPVVPVDGIQPQPQPTV